MRGYHAQNQSQTLQLTETGVLGAHAVNETRFQYQRADPTSVANESGASLAVLGAFNGGASPVGHSSDLQSGFELQNYTSMIRGAHSPGVGHRW